MKFKFKVGDFLLFLGTLSAVIISIILWILIMTNDQRFNQLNQPNLTSPQMRTRNVKSFTDLYMPTNAYGFFNGRPYQLYDSKNNLTFEFARNLKKMKVIRLEKRSHNSETYKKLLNNGHYLQLTYPDEINFHVFANFHLKKGNQKFNRIFISTSNNWIEVGDDDTKQIYRLRLLHANFDRLRHYARIAQRKISVHFVPLNGHYFTFYNHQVNWRIYSYLVDKQPVSYFVSRLLGNAGVSSRTGSHSTTYSLNYYTRLQVPNGGNTYLYTHYEKGQLPGLTNQLLDSLYYVNRLGLDEQNLRFFDVGGRQIAYTNYIEGCPVFLQQNKLQIETTFSLDAVRVHFNNVDFQIPIPFDGEEKSLPATDEVLADLRRHGLPTADIERIVVAYQVQKDKSQHNLVNLQPVYYIKVQGQWHNADQWENQSLQAIQKPSAVKKLKEDR